MRIFTFGDSHSYAGWNQLQLSNVDILINHIGPRLMHTFGQQGLDLLNIKSFKVQDNDVAVFCFGEIDVRRHIGKFFALGYKNIINYVVNNYFVAIKANVDQFKTLQTCIYFVPPTVRIDSIEISTFPFIGSDEERREYARYINERLSESCKTYGYLYFDLYDKYCDSKGFLHPNMRENVHIKDIKPLKDFLMSSVL